MVDYEFGLLLMTTLGRGILHKRGNAGTKRLFEKIMPTVEKIKELKKQARKSLTKSEKQ